MCTFVYVWCFGFYFDFLRPCSLLSSLTDVHKAIAGVFRERQGSECFPPLNSQCVKQAFNKNLFNEKLSEEEGGWEGETRKQKWSQVCGTQRVERRNRKGEPSFLRAFVRPDISHLLCHYPLSLVHPVCLPFPTRRKGHTVDTSLVWVSNMVPPLRILADSYKILSTCQMNNEQVLVSSMFPSFKWIDKLMHYIYRLFCSIWLILLKFRVASISHFVKRPGLTSWGELCSCNQPPTTYILRRNVPYLSFLHFYIYCPMLNI